MKYDGHIRFHRKTIRFSLLSAKFLLYSLQRYIGMEKTYMWHHIFIFGTKSLCIRHEALL
jgi:hypothetical protein